MIRRKFRLVSPPVFAPLIAILLGVIVAPAYPDEGKGAITVTCDAESDFIEIRLHIYWNQDLYAFVAKYPDHAGNDGPAFITLLDSVGDSYRKTCTTISRTVVATLQSVDILSVTENGVAIAVRRINGPFFEGNFDYRIRSSKARSWEECIPEDWVTFDGKVRCGPLTESKTANPTEVADQWK
jgi:hypothetical protein